MNETTGRPAEQLEEHRDTLEVLADSDLPANWIAEALIEVLDE